MSFTPAKCVIGSTVTLYEQSGATGAVSSSAGRNNTLYDGFDDSASLTSATTPNVTLAALAEITLTAGAATIDLTSVSDVNGVTKNFNALKIRCIKFRAKSTAIHAFTIAKGASNGFTGLGASFSVTLPANAAGGAWVSFYDAGGGTAVSGTVKTLDISGTGTDVLQVAIYGGA